MLDFSNYPNFSKFQGKNILAIDYGEKVVGLAFFCPGRDPFPISHGRIINKSFSDFTRQLKLTIDNDAVDVIVFGIAYLLDGKETDKTREQRAIFQNLRSQFSDVDFYEQDETLSTFSAQERMKNSAQFNFKIDITKIDEVSALIILEDFIRKI